MIQRVKSASVSVEGEKAAGIGRGLVVLLGVGLNDTEQDAAWLADKTANLRIFEDAEGKMNLSVGDIEGGVLLVPNFTLYADCEKGRRPGFSGAAAPELAGRLFDEFCIMVQELDIPVAKGHFGAHMQVSLTNDGPVTLIIDSP